MRDIWGAIVDDSRHNDIYLHLQPFVTGQCVRTCGRHWRADNHLRGILIKVYMFKTLILTLCLVAAAVVLLCVRIILVKGGRFPNTHVSGSKHLRDSGIGCVQSQDREAMGRHLMTPERMEKMLGK